MCRMKESASKMKRIPGVMVLNKLSELDTSAAF